MQITPLENWIGRKIGLGTAVPLTRAAIDAYQLRKLRETICTARRHSPFYRHLFSGVSETPLTGLTDIQSLPFTTVTDIKSDPFKFLCVSQDEIARVVTLQTSGTTGQPKRLFFTEDDLELTMDFFHHGMSTLVSPGNRVLILMPGALPYSVGDLLVRGLSRMNVTGIVHGPVKDPEAVVREIIELDIDSLVGIPVQVLGIARCRAAEKIASGRLKSILLSADYVPKAIVDALSQTWRCPVHQHYGLTETGYGGAVECAALSGYHMREADLLFEIIDPETGIPVPKGDTGEVVITTLTRRAMPLIRYRTGDRARFIAEPCPCGTVLSRLDRIQGRLAGAVPLNDTFSISVPMLDSAVFEIAGVLNYQVQLDLNDPVSRLLLFVYPAASATENLLPDVRQTVLAIPDIHDAVRQGSLEVVIRLPKDEPEISSGPQKRKILVNRMDGWIALRHSKPEQSSAEEMTTAR
jgi:phenylacetate-coenzyme A ligase PaaK-like adenylate-forming protein